MYLVVLPPLESTLWDLSIETYKHVVSTYESTCSQSTAPAGLTLVNPSHYLTDIRITGEPISSALTLSMEPFTLFHCSREYALLKYSYLADFFIHSARLKTFKIGPQKM